MNVSPLPVYTVSIQSTLLYEQLLYFLSSISTLYGNLLLLEDCYVVLYLPSVYDTFKLSIWFENSEAGTGLFHYVTIFVYIEVFNASTLTILSINLEF